MSLETNVVSFVLRFVFEEPPDGATRPIAGWHGVVRHVQSDAERSFTRWADAVAFIEQYVSVLQENAHEP